MKVAPAEFVPVATTAQVQRHEQRLVAGTARTILRWILTSLLVLLLQTVVVLGFLFIFDRGNILEHTYRSLIVAFVFGLQAAVVAILLR